MSTGLVWEERFAWHDSGTASSNKWVEPYPALDRAEAKRRFFNLLVVSGLERVLVRVAARPATDEELLRFHTPAYLERVRSLSAADGGDAGESARLGPGGEEIARLAAGGCIEAVVAVASGRVENAYALVRPCGHHAEPDRGRGFSIFGNIVVAARYAQRVCGLERIAVVDWDVHHGNGTELAFYSDPSVLTISMHQDRCYPPDSGQADATGDGVGRGFNINVPLPPGSGHGAYLAACEQIVLPALSAFRPDLILVACGFDAAVGDPLGRMLCYSETYREMTALLKATARKACDGRLVFCHEGGYSATYSPFCGLAVVEELAGVRSEVVDPYLAWYSVMGGQDLQSHQADIIERIAARAAGAGLARISNPPVALPAGRERLDPRRSWTLGQAPSVPRQKLGGGH